MKTIATTIKQEGWHRWPNAPEGHFLGNLHRHIFHFTVEVRVDDLDREVEFFDLQADMRKAFVGAGTQWAGPLVTLLTGAEMSCELMASDLAQYLGVRYEVIRVTVSEDGESEGSWYASSPTP